MRKRGKGDVRVREDRGRRREEGHRVPCGWKERPHRAWASA